MKPEEVKAMKAVPIKASPMQQAQIFHLTERIDVEEEKQQVVNRLVVEEVKQQVDYNPYEEDKE